MRTSVDRSEVAFVTRVVLQYNVEHDTVNCKNIVVFNENIFSFSLSRSRLMSGVVDSLV